MNNEILYESDGYRLTKNSFTYKGYTENLKNIADLEVIESNQKGKVYEGIGLAIMGLGWALAVGVGLNFFFPPVGLYLILPLILLFFATGYHFRAKYTLYITTVDGNTGPIDKSRHSRENFDQLIAHVKTAIIQYC